MEKDKRIGIITYSKTLNYGAFLQCYALQKKIESIIHNSPVIIEYHPSDNRYGMNIIKTSSVKAFVCSIISSPLKMVKIKRFSKLLNKMHMGRISDEYDLAIAGSDQIWNPELTGGKLDPYFSLEKISSKRKISYSSSVGNEKNIPANIEDYKRMSNRLDCMSVREEGAKNLFERYLDRDVELVIDPTALLTKEQWEADIKNIKTDKNDYIFSYFIGIREDQKKALAKICEMTHMKTTSYSNIPKEKHIYKYCYSDGPFEFLARLRDSKLVITSSFHGTIFSIIFHKNFYVLMPSKDKRGRMDNILKITGLTDRIIESEDDLGKINLKDIDYSEPQKKLDSLREKSIKWLKNAIGQ